jgi:hypothetical protein
MHKRTLGAVITMILTAACSGCASTAAPDPAAPATAASPSPGRNVAADIQKSLDAGRLPGPNGVR